MGSTRIAVLGGTGWLGRALVARLAGAGRQVVSPTREALEGVDEAGLRALLQPGDDLAVVNLVGRRRGSPTELVAANAECPTRLARALAGSGSALVQLGSAAEYGDPGSAAPVQEHATPQPVGEYGRTKLAGTRAALTYEGACVLRAFNIVDADLPSGSVVAEILGKIERARAEDSAVELLSADDVRDYVSRSFVVASLERALELRPHGLFNLCSGTGVSYRDLVGTLAEATGGTLPVRDRGEPGIRAIVGDPSAWRELTGLSELLDAARIARIVVGG